MTIERDQDSRIWKYALPMSDVAIVDMPCGAEVLCVQMQRGEPYLWCKCSIHTKKEARTFFVVGTGHPMPCDAGRYVGTFQFHESVLVFPVFEGK